MKKILHIFPETVFFEGYIELLKLDKKNVHKFILTDIGSKFNVDEKKYDSINYKKINTFKLNNIIKFKKMLENSDADIIIFHSGYLQYLILGLSKRTLKKTVLVLWGGADSKKFTVRDSNKKYFVQAFFYDRIRRKVYKRLKYIGSIIPSDYENIKKEYKVKAKYIACKYPIPNKPIESKLKTKRKTIIQVGHSGFDSGEHLEILKKIKRFKEENIKICMPLSYGNSSYIKEICKNSKKIFGDKSAPMLKLLSFEEYSKYLSNIDILIINCKIQQALGNIYLAFYAGKKVYLNPKGSLWEFFSKEKFVIHSTEELDQTSFKEFTYISEEEKTHNHKKSLDIFDNRKLFQYWKKVFDLKL